MKITSNWYKIFKWKPDLEQANERE